MVSGSSTSLVYLSEKTSLPMESAMKAVRPILLALLILPALLVAGQASAKPVRAFVPGKPWMLSLDLQDFEPESLLGQKTILGGHTRDGITVTVIMEKTKASATAKAIREQYGQSYVSGFGVKETAQRTGGEDMAILLYKWNMKGVPGDTWGFNGYTVKDGVAFDIHLSADMSRHTKEQMLAIINSFKLQDSAELKDMIALSQKLKNHASPAAERKLLDAFAAQYPNNPFVFWMLGEHHFKAHELQAAEQACLRALENHKTQPMINPYMVWCCDDYLGRCYGMEGKYEESRKYLDLGYKLAKQMERKNLVAQTAYNLACWHAEKGKTQDSLLYLAEALELAPERKPQAQKDASFAKIKDNPQFKSLLSP